MRTKHQYDKTKPNKHNQRHSPKRNLVKGQPIFNHIKQAVYPNVLRDAPAQEQHPPALQPPAQPDVQLPIVAAPGGYLELASLAGNPVNYTIRQTTKSRVVRHITAGSCIEAIVQYELPAQKGVDTQFELKNVVYLVRYSGKCGMLQIDRLAYHVSSKSVSVSGLCFLPI